MQLTSLPPSTPADMGDAKRVTNPLAVSKKGPFYVVLGGDEPGVYESRPADVTCGFNLDPLPIVVICSTIKEAMKVDLLNSEVFMHVDPEDVDAIKDALQASKAVTAPFANGERLYAFKVAQETGIYGGYKWSDLSHMTKFPKCMQQSFTNFYDALYYMLDKSELSSKRATASAVAAPLPTSYRAASPVKMSRGPSPVKREASPPHTPTKVAHFSRPGSPAKPSQKLTTPAPPPTAAPVEAPDNITRTYSLPTSSISARGFPIVSISSPSRRPLPQRDTSGFQFYNIITHQRGKGWVYFVATGCKCNSGGPAQ
ncbi:hypothetical protein ONZ51_g13049 [Trametes cubensis]|uniref:Uncharacterized protein n=1 Tax=Trametes cubensis TaxID=1111947 RepID=A0AAD7TF35_9APHY|nr:hypothetical protein ONZ51_g13049 [Trametes cubensis]